MILSCFGDQHANVSVCQSSFVPWIPHGWTESIVSSERSWKDSKLLTLSKRLGPKAEGPLRRSWSRIAANSKELTTISCQ